MNKSELIDAIAASADIPKAAAGRALDAVIESVTGALKAGDSVVLVGFGTFSVTDRPARTGRNPQTGKTLEIPDNIKQDLQIKPVKWIDEVLQIALQYAPEPLPDVAPEIVAKEDKRESDSKERISTH